MGEPQPKKVVGKSVAIALGLICAVLSTGLVGAVTYYTSIINQKDSEIAELQGQISALQSQVNELRAIVNLEKVAAIADHRIINQPPSSATTWPSRRITLGTKSFRYTPPQRIRLTSR